MQTFEQMRQPTCHLRWIADAISQGVTNSLLVDHQVLRVAGGDRHVTAVTATGGKNHVSVHHSAEV